MLGVRCFLCHLASRLGRREREKGAEETERQGVVEGGGEAAREKRQRGGERETGEGERLRVGKRGG